MPAVILPEDQEDENLTDTTAERDTTLPDPTPPAPPQQKDDAGVPDKFKGKTQAEIIAAYHDLERVTGRQGEELGQLRSTHDQYIKAALEAAQRQPAQKDTQETQDDNDAEFFINPKAAIAKALENHPLLKEVKEKTQQSQQERAEQAFRAKHPDSAEVLADPEFRAWVESVPARKKRLLEANANYDFETGDELFSTYKEIKAAKAVATPAPASKDTAAAQAARAAALNAGKVPGGNASPPGSTSVGKIFRRSDLTRLRNENPEKYHEMGDEILLAYKENRVK